MNVLKPRIAVLGTGRMGSALVRAFLKQGYSTDIWNRTKSKAEPLAAFGARIATTVQAAVAAAEVVVVNVNDYVTTDHLFQADGMTKTLRGKLLVQLASGTPKQAREMAAWAQQHEIRYLDGAIMATPNLIGTPECTLLYSGPGDLFEEYKPILLTLGENTLYVGSDVGHASALDNAILVFFWGTLFSVLQGASICEAEKFPLDAYMSSIKAVMPAVNGSVADLVKRIQDRRFAGDEATLATVDTCHASIRYLLELSKEHGIHHAVLDGFDQIFQAAIKAGRAQDDFAVLHKFMR